jgi:hypothetical protein
MTTNTKKLRLSINPHLVDKALDTDKRFFSHGFHAMDISIDELAEVVTKDGFAFSYQYQSDHRIRNQFKATDVLAVDIDGGIRIPEMLEKPLVKSHCSMLYVTASHTLEHHRFRLVFVLPRTINKASDVVAASRSLARRLGGDPSVTDAARMFFGSRGSDPLIFDAALSEEMLDELIQDGQVTPSRDSIGYSRSTSNRSNLKVDTTMEVRSSSGALVTLGSIQKITSIYCPFHHDRSPSAFVNRNHKKNIYLRCSTCDLTWWQKDMGESSIDFYDFEKTVKKLSDKDFRNVFEDTPFGDFIEPIEIPLKNIHILSKDRLKISKLDNGITFIKSPKGSGKTTFLSDAIRQVIVRFPTLMDMELDRDKDSGESYFTNEKVLLIGHRRALIGDLCAKLDLNCYLDDKKFRMGEINERQNRYGICLDSLEKLRYVQYDIIVIDEVEQVLSHFLSDTIGEKRQALFRLFCEKLKNAKKVVGLDADLGWVTFNTLTSLVHSTQSNDRTTEPVPVHIYLNVFKANNAEVNLFESQMQLIEHMQRSIIEGKRVFITSNSKEKIKTLSKTIEKLVADHGLKISMRMITSENSQHEDTQQFIKQIKSEILNCDVTLSSPSLGTGIDITFDGGEQKIDCVYGFFENLINSHFEIDQQLARVRHPGSVHVWVSPSTFKFDTDFGVVCEDYLHDQMLDLSYSGYHNQTGLPVAGIDPFFIMAAMITTIQRASKNNLKRNFIDYKERNGWKIVHQDIDEEMIYLGKEAFKYGKIAKESDSIKDILNANVFNNVEYRQFTKKIDTNEVVSVEEWQSFRKTNLEIFYGEPVTKALIDKDDKGRFSTKIRRYENLMNLHKVISQEGHGLITDKSASIENRIFKSSPVGDQILYQLLSATPIFVDGKFKPNTLFTKMDLSTFIDMCKNASRQIETHLEISVRGDVDENPVRQLGDLLKLVGLSQKKSKPSIKNGDKTYYYLLDNESMEEVKTLVERRKSPGMTGWKYINQTYGFEYTDDDWDIIMNGVPDRTHH